MLISLSEELYNEFQTFAQEYGYNRSALIRRLIIEYMTRNKQNP